jgi:alpha-1,2-mannosyltransferase
VTRVVRPLSLAALAVGLALAVALAPGHRGWFDVGVYYGTVHYWLDNGGQVYDYLRPGTTYGFTYPPFAALCMVPMELVSWHAAVAVSIALNAAASVLLLYWLVYPIVLRRGWPRWYAMGLAACLFAALEPVRDTFSFGQVNLLLLALVYADLRQLSRGSRLAGVGIGLATAVKLTPALFIGYLLIARRYRAAAVAAGTAAGATLLAALVMPGASQVFWTGALWDTGRIGTLGYVSNQSLRGTVARLDPTGGGLVWALGVVAMLALWAYRIRRTAGGSGTGPAGSGNDAAGPGSDAAGFALTGVVACLVSPVTWVHHLVWLIPALVLLADDGLTRAQQRLGRGRLAAAGVIFVLLASGPVWLWSPYPHGIGGFLGGNAYVWVALALLAVVPATAADPPPGHAGRLVRSMPGPSGWRTPAN